MINCDTNSRPVFKNPYSRLPPRGNPFRKVSSRYLGKEILCRRRGGEILYVKGDQLVV